MKLQDYAQFENFMCTSLETDVSGLIREKVTIEKETSLKMSDEEMHMLAHKLSTHMPEETIYNIISSEVNRVRSQVK